MFGWLSKYQALATPIALVVKGCQAAAREGKNVFDCCRKFDGKKALSRHRSSGQSSSSHHAPKR